MSFIKDFKAFAMKGSVIDLAIGVVIGAAFGKIVTSMVEDVIMPLVGVVTGNGQMFVDKFTVLKPGKDGKTAYASLDEAKKAGANVFAYGHLIQTIVDFIIVAFCIFIVVQLLAKMKRKDDKTGEAKPVELSSTDKLLVEIRDRLPAKNTI